MSGCFSVEVISLVVNELTESIAIVSCVLSEMVMLEREAFSDCVSVGLEGEAASSAEDSCNLSFRMRRLSTNSMCNRRL